MSGSRNNLILRGANIVAFVVTVIINALAGVGYIGGRTTAAISGSYPALVTPAGYVFSIWGVIYILLAAFVVYQALPRQGDKQFIREIGSLFLLSSAFNVIWLFAWQYGQIVLSVIPMFALLATLIAIYLRLRIGKSTVSLRERLDVHLPFSVYLGWITVATIADVAAALVSIDWAGLGLSPVTWAMLVLIIALAIALTVVLTRRDLGYGLVLVWAFVGIAVNQAAYQNVSITAELCAGVVAIALVAAIIYSRLKR